MREYNAAVRKDVPFDHTVKDGKCTVGHRAAEVELGAARSTRRRSTPTRRPAASRSRSAACASTRRPGRCSTSTSTRFPGLYTRGRDGRRPLLLQLSERHRARLGRGVRPHGRRQRRRKAAKGLEQERNTESAENSIWFLYDFRPGVALCHSSWLDAFDHSETTMSHEATTRQSLHPRHRGVRLRPPVRRDPGGGPAPHQAADARLARLRALRRGPRVVPHPPGFAREGGHDARVRDLGHEARSSPRRTPRSRTAPQVQGFELDDVHRAGVLHVGAVVLPALISIAGAQGRHERQGIPDGRGRRLRDRAARRPVHGAGAHRVGLALGRDARRVLRRGRRRARPEARRRQDGARARHRRHAGRGPDGGAVRRDGEAHARRPLLAERALRRAASRRPASPASSTCWKANTAASARRSRSRRTTST